MAFKKEVKAKVKEEAQEAKGFFKQMWDRLKNAPTSVYVALGALVAVMVAVFTLGGA